MCGISGIFFFKEKKKVKKKYLDKMNDILNHRGPDGRGNWISSNKNIGFGHTRLSILDLSTTANQPLLDNTKNYVITFNGEIYNFKEIKKILLKKGYIFNTKNSDTEVLLLSYIEWGLKCVDKFRGMFAFAIWDNIKKKVFLVRDRVGVKPLYYKLDSDKLIFSSEIKAILLDPDYIPEIDEESMYHYLTFLCTPAPKTMFKQINKLEAGTWLSFDEKGNSEKKQYWDPLQDKELIDLENINKVLVRTLKESIKYRGISDVDVGVFLSGGIDSSTNAYFFSKDSKKKIKTFSIGYDKEYKSYKSELNYARIVAKHIKSLHFEKKLRKDDVKNLIFDMVYFQDEPISDPVCVPIFYVSKLARENNVKVCQVGEGADELFFGYTNWLRTSKINLLLNNLFFPNFLKRLILLLYKKFNIQYKYTADLLRRSLEKKPIFWGGAEAFSSFEKNQLFSNSFKKKIKNFDSWDCIRPHYEFFNKNAKYKNIENWMTYLDLKIRLPELILMRIDKMTMANSLEARVPFLDHNLVQKTIDLPKKIKIKKNKLKVLLKDIVKGLLPYEILNRKKQGFGLPLKEWFEDGLGINEKKIINEFVNKTDFFKKETIQKIIDRKGDTRLWFLLNLAIWWKIFIKNNKLKIS
ncbi:MAG: asparagine synthase (glutamine-hydrolyzing) [Alphaproteobacteria bacterium]